MGKLNCRSNEYQCDLIILQITEGNNSAYQVTPSRSTCTIPMSFYFSVNKQLADKERIAAALENTHLLKVVNQCLTVKQWEQELKCTSRKLQRTHSSWIPVFFFANIPHPVQTFLVTLLVSMQGNFINYFIWFFCRFLRRQFFYVKAAEAWSGLLSVKLV